MLAALLLPNVFAVRTAQSVCVYNSAAFVLKWHLHDNVHNTNSKDTGNYPVLKTKCMSSLDAGSQVTAGTELVPSVKAFWGKRYTSDVPVLYDQANCSQVTYICKGTTLHYSCKIGTPPAITPDMAKDAGEFILGFVEGLGSEIGFSKCISDVSGAHSNLQCPHQPPPTCPPQTNAS